MSTTDERLMKPQEVADLLRKSKSWVYAACERGEIPSRKIGRDLRVDRAELHKWLESKTLKPTPAQLKEEA